LCCVVFCVGFTSEYNLGDCWIYDTQTKKWSSVHSPNAPKYRYPSVSQQTELYNAHTNNNSFESFKLKIV
jgi:hypothetical protein